MTSYPSPLAEYHPRCLPKQTYTEGNSTTILLNRNIPFLFSQSVDLTNYSTLYLTPSDRSIGPRTKHKAILSPHTPPRLTLEPQPTIQHLFFHHYNGFQTLPPLRNLLPATEHNRNAHHPKDLCRDIMQPHQGVGRRYALSPTPPPSPRNQISTRSEAELTTSPHATQAAMTTTCTSRTP